MIKRIFVLLASTITLLTFQAWSQMPGPVNDRVLLPNGWWLSPHGEHLGLHDFPVNAALTADERWLAVLHSGHSRPQVRLIDVKEMKTTSVMALKDAWYGIQFAGKRLYVSGGNQNCVYVLEIVGDSLVAMDTLRFEMPRTKFLGAVAGISIRRHMVATAVRNDSSLRYFNLQLRSEKRVHLGGMPYACKYLVDGKILVSLWNKKKVVVYNDMKLIAEIPTGDHPTEITLSGDGSTAYVPNANDNTLTVIDLKSMQATATVVTSLYPGSPEGSTPNSSALTPDGKSLLIANADNNALTVVALRNKKQPTPVGFIPVGWYPTKVMVLKDATVIVLNGKGDRSPANPNREYIGGLLKGTLSWFPMPDRKMLTSLSEKVYENTPYRPYQLNETKFIGDNPVPSQVGKPSPIKHVFYIIKENRTYDQVFGDIPGGNGDSSLAIFGENISPNHHKLAREFVLFDNFYVNSEVSADGHNWSDAAYATDYVEKTWPGQYGGRGGEYDFNGTEPASRPQSGYIWDLCARSGVGYRSYGEFVENGKGPADSNFTTEPGLKGHIAPFYRGWDLSYSDIDREHAWERELEEFESNGGLPQFNILALPNDHTSGTGRNQLTPQAFVAQNDLALGRFIERLSKSKFWPESAVFVVEDDAQNGPDHVDAHRSIALVVSPYTKRHCIDHTLYTQASMLRTMELILGMPPMSQYDAAAPPMYSAFTSVPDTTRYVAESPRYDLTRKNKDGAYGQNLIDKMNLKKVDAVPDRLFNEIIWRSIKGTSMPPPRYSIFSGAPRDDEDEDDE